MMEENKWNNFEETYKNNSLTLNMLFIFLHFLFSSTFSFNFLGIKHSLKNLMEA